MFHISQNLLHFFLLKDLPGALTEAQVSEALGLHVIKSRPWAIYRTSAVKGEGLFEGLDWYLSLFEVLFKTFSFEGVVL